MIVSSAPKSASALLCFLDAGMQTHAIYRKAPKVVSLSVQCLP